jgi:hypothetical protein
MWAAGRQDSGSRAVAGVGRRPGRGSRILRWLAGAGSMLATLPASAADASLQSLQVFMNMVWLTTAGALVFFIHAQGTIAAGLFRTGAPFDAYRVTVRLFGMRTALLRASPTVLLTYWLVDRVVGLRSANLHEQRELGYSELAETGHPEFRRDVRHAEKS